MNYFEELSEWNRQVDLWIGPDARLLHVSHESSDIRVYGRGDRIFKIRRLTPASVHGRSNSLEDEHLILKWLHARIPGRLNVPKPIAYRRAPGWECIELERLDPPRQTDPVTNPLPETLRGLLHLARAVWRLNRAGISHGDLVPGNAGLDTNGRFALLDFDQAASGHPIRCFLRDFLGFAAAGRAARFTVFDRACRLRWIAPISRACRALRRLAGGRRGKVGEPWNVAARCAVRNDPRLSLLNDAWSIAAESGANSPGRKIAYYSLDIEGVHFSGERPWHLRWDALARAVDFRNKRFVELGCNMGLLSVHTKFFGAREVIGADCNPHAIRAAETVAKTFSVEARFVTADFDSDPDWEQRLGPGDVVSALSLTYWLRDKERLWRYLANFREILFEGHEPEAETRAKLRNLGYTDIRELGVSERQRKLLYAVRR